MDWEDEAAAYRRRNLHDAPPSPDLPATLRKKSVPLGNILEGEDVSDEESKNDDSSGEEGTDIVMMLPNDGSSILDEKWIEYTAIDGSKLWFEPNSQTTSMLEPAVSGKAGFVKTLGTIDENLLNPSTLKRNFDRARRNSNILGSAWIKDDRSSSASSDQPNRKSSGGENTQDEDGEDEDGDGDGPPTSPKFQPIVKTEEEMSLERITHALSMIESHVDGILDQSQNLSSTICEDLRSIRDKVQSVHDQLVENDLALDERDDCEALVEMKKLPWNFDNEQVTMYRKLANADDHSSYKYDSWHFPQYFSEFPLPVTASSISCTVILPEPEEEELTISGFEVKKELRTTEMLISSRDTVSQVVRDALEEAKLTYASPEDYVLKASGLNDYMEGERLVFDHEYIRNCIRDMRACSVSVVKKPEVFPQVALDTELFVSYQQRVDHKAQIPDPLAHRGLSSRVPWHSLSSIPITDVQTPFRLRILGCDNLDPAALPRLAQLEGGCTHVFLSVFVFHGIDKLKGADWKTPAQNISKSPRWSRWLTGYDAPLLSALPRESRVGYMLYGVGESLKEDVLLAWGSVQLIDDLGHLSTGRQSIKLWSIPAKEKGKHKKRDLADDFIFRASNRQNESDPNPLTVFVEFDRFEKPVVAPRTTKYRPPNPRAVGLEIPLTTLSQQDQARLETLIQADSLYPFQPEDFQLIWKMRHVLVPYSRVLPQFLQSVDWTNKEHCFEAYRLLNLWSPPTELADAMELLDAKYPDYVVREYAVTLLRRFKDDELRLYLLQFTQLLKFEPYHDSPLLRFLMQRALASPFNIGHHFFWHLKAELHNPHFCERFGLVLEEYLSKAGRYANELRKQNSAVLKLQRVAEMVVRLKREHGYSDDDCMPEYCKEIEKLNRDFFAPMGKFQIPYNPKLEATTLIVSKCRYMSSKMVPLWLVFNNADPNAPPIYLIFKSGDDLRQDILTIQLLFVMDKIWLANGLDMRLKPYHVIATGVNAHGEGVGMIEVVMNSDTTSGIQLKYGGGAMGALKMDPLDLFLKDHNKGELYDKAVENFVASCAGYCVATFVLGIGDRHNGNIMVTKDGHLFHIDFGHFLGNFKKKFGVNRERAAFVFTPEMAYVMGGKKYKKSAKFRNFMTLCTHAFRCLRQNAKVLENLFILMVSAGMPELMVTSDILYMRDKLCLDISEKKADKVLHSEIQKSLDSTYRRIDNMIHNFRHG